MSLRLLNHGLADRLPTELWDQILGELSYTEMIKCKMLSRRFQRIVRAMLKMYKGRLGALALANVEDSDVPFNECKRMLHRYHQTWEVLSGDMGPSPISTHLPNHQSPPLILESGWIVIEDFTGDLTFAKIPTISSLHDPIPHDGWSVKANIRCHQLPRFVAYRFDPSQDLLVILGPSSLQRYPDIHVLTMITQRPHPLAQHSIFDAGIGPLGEINSFEVYQDLILVFAGTDEDRILRVWNWKTGEDIFTLEGFDALGDLATFIGDRTLLLVQEYELRLFRFAEDDVVHTCDLELPRFIEPALQIWTTVSHPLSNVPESGRAFVTDPDKGIVVINMIRSVPDVAPDKRCSIILAIRVAALLAEARRHSAPVAEEAYSDPRIYEVDRSGYACSDSDSDSDSNADTTTPEVPIVMWNDWGPQNARFVHFDEECETPSTFGSRCVLLSPSCRDRPAEIVLFDFGLDTEEISISTRTHTLSSEWTVEVVSAHTSLDMSGWFEDTTWVVDTGLPYRVRRRAVPELPNGACIEAALWENGIMVKKSDGGQCEYFSMSMHGSTLPP
ncbi:hypothetical protein DICSQDRAFT_167927 [Dichomitus squalens LYAD-421 SS1]|uniref:uncharacterized protein n=1 Tax=Dichomitus squalens (strain LYAD-421) TaxID=732165 RepID=UPI0004414869|nr:uncharacterized protein DICSQDRAFT_167927 [Dichomitus squalens LYAD-421 SS1]EJF63877.1 hypothetical protein DICSQDRAFT_167927 [Dichomitus squalens LYAD-421 SS1]